MMLNWDHHEASCAPPSNNHVRKAWAQKSITHVSSTRVGSIFRAAHFRKLLKLFIIVIPFMLHARGQRNHSKVVRIHNVVKVPGKPNEIPSSVSGALPPPAAVPYVHRGGAGGLTYAAACILTQLAQSLHQSEGCGGFPFTQGSRGDCRNFNKLAVGFVLKTIHNLKEVQFAHSPHREYFVFLESEPISPLGSRRHVFFGGLSYFPIGHLGSIVGHVLRSSVICKLFAGPAPVQPGHYKGKSRKVHFSY
jgi:hypothetical protein